MKGVFDKISRLIEKFSEDQADRNKFEEIASISVINHTSQSIEEHHAIHMWFLLYIEVLLRMHHKISDRKELVDLCRTVCQGNSFQLEILDEFESTYDSIRAIWWYTRESCLYRILNKALRHQDYSTLFAFRFFISDIAKEINIHYEKYLRTNTTRSAFVVYRGQAIHENELDMLKKNIGEYLSMNSFFSTSLKESIALKFIRSLPNEDHYEKILFQIQIDPTFQCKSFAHVKELSYCKNEDEVLIMLGALFHIQNLSHDPDKHIWIAKLTLADENDFHLKDTFTHMKQKIGQETNLASLGKILFEMGEYDQVELCYEQMKYQAQLELSAAHSGLGKAALGKNDFVKAAQAEEEALKIKSSILKKNHRDLAISYSRLGDIYCKQKDYPHALKYLKKAVKIQELADPLEPLILAKTYHRVAQTCVELNDYPLAMEYYNKTLEIRKENLPSMDKSIASTYFQIGKLYSKQEIFDQALDYCQQALTISKRVLPPKHPNIQSIEVEIRTLKKEMKN